MLSVVGAALLRGGRCQAARRGPGMPLAGKWEFPGGKLERGEAPEAALARELREELGVEARVEELLGRGEVFAEGRHVALDVYAARLEPYDAAIASLDVPVRPSPRLARARRSRSTTT